MKICLSAVTLAGAALGVALIASDASAQRTTRSSMRIPVSKEAPFNADSAARADSIARAEALERMRQDSIANANRMRQDSIANAERMRQDSIARAEQARRDSIAYADSVARAEAEARRLRQIGGFYIGLGGGAALPTRDMDVAHNTGWNITVPFGWDPVGSPFGVRLDAGYTQFQSRNAYFGTRDVGNTQMFTGSLDAKLRLPVGSRYIRRFSVYAVGGGNWFNYKNLELVPDPDETDQTVLLADDDWNDRFGWNAGGGLQFGWGRSNVFVESRYMSFSREGLKGGHVPIILGLSWF